MSARDQILELKRRIAAAVIGQEAVVDLLLVALLVSCPQNTRYFVAIKMGRRQGARREHISTGYVTDEQRRRRPIFIATLRAGAIWLFFRVARSTRMTQIWALRSRLEKQPTDLRQNTSYFGARTLADGHLLMEGLPGLAKTRTIKTLAKNLESEFRRIQFTPDLLPSDITGTEIYTGEGAGGTFRFQPGPIFGNLILADEINRAPAKAQAALLEAMEERQVTSGGKTNPLPQLFLVLATQNPIEQEGTYPLPEAQMDRFLLHVFIGYPTDENEVKILRLIRGEEAGTMASTEAWPQSNGTLSPNFGRNLRCQSAFSRRRSAVRNATRLLRWPL
jgi:ATPase family associated with various cellular activities (AAA)